MAALSLAQTLSRVITQRGQMMVGSKLLFMFVPLYYYIFNVKRKGEKVRGMWSRGRGGIGKEGEI